MRFSVVMPTFNQGRYIRQAVDSVLDQAGVDVELIVMDAGSTDETLAELAPFLHRIRLISEPDEGQSDAINKGFQLATGEILTWLNSDDFYEPGALRCAADVFQARPEVDVVYGDMYTVDPAGAGIKRIIAPDFRPDFLRRRNPIQQPATFYRRRLVEKVGMLDISLHYCMDYDLWWRFILASPSGFHHVARPLASFRVHGDSKSHSFDWRFRHTREHIFRVRRRYTGVQRLADYWDFLHDAMWLTARFAWKRIAGRL